MCLLSFAHIPCGRVLSQIGLFRQMWRERDGKEELDRLQPREEEAVWIICCVKNDSFVTGNGLFLLHSTLDFRRVFDRHEMCQNEKNLSRL